MLLPKHFLTEPDQAVSEEAAARFREALGRRLNREPLFYITGEREFYRAAVLRGRAGADTTRPETELLVEEAIAAVADMGDAHEKGSGLLIADIGTGSGCIVVATATVLTEARFFASDISAEAVEVAQANAERHGVADQDHIWRWRPA